jgi:4-hydroxy-2-oxoglutarate aldolase
MRKLRGVLCPVATPFDHAGELYPTKVRHHLARLGRTRLAGYVLTSWDGEGSLLSHQERLRAWELGIEAAGDKPCIAAASAESVHETVALAKSAQELGCQGLWLRTPSDYRGPEDETRATLFLRTVADRAGIPVAFAVDIRRPLSARASAEVARHPNVAAVCYRGADVDWIRELADYGVDPERIWVGRESLWRAAWDLGSRTAVLAMANAAPFHLLSIEEALRTREYEAAEDLIARALDAAEIPALYGPAGLKAAMDLRGSFGGSPRLPLVAVDPEALADIERRLTELSS